MKTQVSNYTQKKLRPDVHALPKGKTNRCFFTLCSLHLTTRTVFSVPKLTRCGHARRSLTHEENEGTHAMKESNLTPCQRTMSIKRQP